MSGDVADLTRIPESLRADIDQLVTTARAVDGAVADLCAMAQRVWSHYRTATHPSLGMPDAPDEIDVELMDASGLSDSIVLLGAIAARSRHACASDLERWQFEALGLSGPGIDHYRSEHARLIEIMDSWERAGMVVIAADWLVEMVARRRAEVAR